MKISPAQLGAVFDHVDEVHPEECCGYLVLKEGRVVEVHAGRNVAQFPGGLYEMDSDSLVQAALKHFDGFGIVVYHSHPNMSPVPSIIDTEDAVDHPPDWRYLIVGRDEFALWEMLPDGMTVVQHDIQISEEEVEVGNATEA